MWLADGAGKRNERAGRRMNEKRKKSGRVKRRSHCGLLLLKE